MCARFTLMMPWKDLVRLLGAISAEKGEASWNVAPTDLVAIVEDDVAGRRIVGAKWGLTVPWSPKPLINARAETAAEKAVFKKALRESRCLIPTTGFYEWRQEGSKKQPFLFRRPDGAPYALAGLIKTRKTEEGEVTECTILTTDASKFVSRFHNRMPVIVEKKDWDRWLDRSVTEAEGVADILRPAPEDFLEAVPVSPRVNNPRNDDPGLVEPAGPAVVPD